MDRIAILLLPTIYVDTNLPLSIVTYIVERY